jgi:pimeloyl-ACP methyl ester carboxylesterase
MASAVLVYFHGNSTDIGRCHIPVRRLGLRLRAHVLMVEYPGYGMAAGRPTEDSLIACADAVVRCLTETLGVPLDHILLLGRSIGTGPAIAVAGRHPGIGGLIAVSAFTSISPVATRLVGSRVRSSEVATALTAGFLCDRFRNDTAVAALRCSSVFIHGREDPLIPFDHSVALIRECGGPARLCVFDGMDHDNCFSRQHLPAIAKAVAGFLPCLAPSSPRFDLRIPTALLEPPPALLERLAGAHSPTFSSFLGHVGRAAANSVSDLSARAVGLAAGILCPTVPAELLAHIIEAPLEEVEEVATASDPGTPPSGQRSPVSDGSSVERWPDIPATP